MITLRLCERLTGLAVLTAIAAFLLGQLMRQNSIALAQLLALLIERGKFMLDMLVALFVVA